MHKYVVLEKAVGETPLEVVEHYRKEHPELLSKMARNFWMRLPLVQAVRRLSRACRYGEEPNLPNEQQDRQKAQTLPLAYAGRLDPMASGKLLVLIGDECKVQEKYHHLDKAYDFSVLFGVATDTADVLGLITASKRSDPILKERDMSRVCEKLVGPIELPYPHFSSKTVKGKPLHTWAVEGRLNEITIPTKRSTIHQLKLRGLTTKSGQQIYDEVSQKIETIPPVTDPRKALGNDFRRPDVRESWAGFLEQYRDDAFTIGHFTCIASSGTYMRTLAEVIAKEIGTVGLAYHIHRTEIGTYQPFPLVGGFWKRRF